jgi:prepilin-type N-terminal cleavage/methylation domain-containing protein
LVTSPIKDTTDASGYSLVEVMVAIVVLAVAVVPMVGMFEAAIQAANASGDYDKARTCAVQKLEQVKSLPYEAVEEGLQGGVCAPSGFGYTITAQPIGTDLSDESGEEGLSRITVTVDWGGENSYGVTGVVSRW